MFQMKEHDKTSGKKKTLMKQTYQIKEFSAMVIKMLTNLGRRMDEHSENFNKETENIRKYQTEVTELGKKKQN